jgi:hypothetical protein
MLRIVQPGLSALLTLSGATGALAGEVTGQVTRIVLTPANPALQFPGGVAFVHLSGTISGRPACNTLSAFAINLNAVGGKQALAALQLAQALGDTVRVVGTGTCTLWDQQREDLLIVDVN